MPRRICCHSRKKNHFILNYPIWMVFKNKLVIRICITFHQLTCLVFIFSTTKGFFPLSRALLRWSDLLSFLSFEGRPDDLLVFSLKSPGILASFPSLTHVGFSIFFFCVKISPHLISHTSLVIVSSLLMWFQALLVMALKVLISLVGIILFVGYVSTLVSTAYASFLDSDLTLTDHESISSNFKAVVTLADSMTS